MEDEKIIELYWNRSESAIVETNNKYGSYCRTIAYNILYDYNDSEECVNDTYLKVWNTLPPQKPKFFSSYIAKIVRNLSLNLYYKKHALKRGGGEIPLLLDELSECIPSKNIVENYIEKKENEKCVEKAISTFIRTLNDSNKRIFIKRYFYAESIKNLAYEFGMSESKVKSLLYRNRQNLKIYLEKEGIGI